MRLCPPWTTGCNKCFRVTENLGGNEVFECQWPNCRHRTPRDLNGAVGILVRRLVTTAVPSRLGQLATTEPPAPAAL